VSLRETDQIARSGQRAGAAASHVTHDGGPRPQERTNHSLGLTWDGFSNRIPRAPCRTPATVGARRAPWRALRAGPVDGSHGSNDPSRIGTIQPVPLPHGLVMLLWTDNFKLFSPIALMASFVLVALYNVKRGPYRYDFALSDPARDHRPSKRRPRVLTSSWGGGAVVGGERSGLLANSVCFVSKSVLWCFAMFCGVLRVFCGCFVVFCKCFRKTVFCGVLRCFADVLQCFGRVLRMFLCHFPSERKTHSTVLRCIAQSVFCLFCAFCIFFGQFCAVL